MDPSCLEHALTETERLEFLDRGYFVLDNLLTEEQILKLETACDKVDAEVRAERGVGPHARLTVRDVMWRDPSLLDLVDLPTALPKVWELLGWNIQIYHSVIAYSPPEAPENREVRHQGWHQDSGQLNDDMEYLPRPMVSLKVAYFLSDCMSEGMANFWVVPGSQLKDRPTGDRKVPPEGAEPVFVPRGGAVVFDRRIWHTATSNGSDVCRKALFYGYSYRWLRPRDDQKVEHLIDGSDPIRRQLLGHGPTGGFGFTSPNEEDVPLREWIREHIGEEAIAPRRSGLRTA
jgi:ectoine hydroxylase